MTTNLLQEIENRLLAGESAYSISKRVGMTAPAIGYWREKLGIEAPYPGRCPRILTIRNARTGQLLAYGTVRECAEQMGLSFCYVQQLEWRIKNGEISKYSVERE